MPADDNDYNGKRGVEDVRHALNELKKANILHYIVTVPPDEGYYSEQFGSMKEYLDYLYLDPKNYSVIGSEKELDSAFSACVKNILPKLRRTRGL